MEPYSRNALEHKQVMEVLKGTLKIGGDALLAVGSLATGGGLGGSFLAGFAGYDAGVNIGLVVGGAAEAGFIYKLNAINPAYSYKNAYELRDEILDNKVGMNVKVSNIEKFAIRFQEALDH